MGDLLSNGQKAETPMIQQSRAPKLLGDFGEGLVTYTLIRKKFEVAVVDHVGADLIAEKNGARFAISVKTRLFRESTNEGLAFVIEEEHLNKLDYFAGQFAMIPMFASVICLADENSIHMILTRSDNIRKNFPKVKHGFSYSFAKSKRRKLIEDRFIDYSCWANETIGAMDFGVSSALPEGLSSE